MIGLRMDTADSLLKAFWVIYTRCECIFYPSVLELTGHIEPEAGTFILTRIHAQEFFYPADYTLKHSRLLGSLPYLLL